MIAGMTQVPLSNSISYNFMVQMIPHHQAAIAMCQNLLKYTTNIPLQDIAINIISEQTKSIQDMQNILLTCQTMTNSPQEIQQYQNQLDKIKNQMFTRMRNAHTNNSINTDFIHEMIPHHQGAIEMSRLTLENHICDQLKPILKAIISSQEKGVQQMETLLKKMNNQ